MKKQQISPTLEEGYEDRITRWLGIRDFSWLKLEKRRLEKKNWKCSIVENDKDKRALFVHSRSIDIE
jgi:hypothetical protein